MSEDFIERQIAIGLITSSQLHQDISAVFEPQLLQSQAAITITTWCRNHYLKHNKAPGRDIQLIFDKHCRRGKLDKDQQEDIEDILLDLSEQEQENEIDIAVLSEEAKKYLAERALLQFADEIRLDAERGDSQAAHAKIGAFLPPDTEQPTDPDFFADDPERTRKIFEDTPEPVIEYPGKLGELLNEHMVRGGFVAFLGQEKIGKTWTLMDIGFQGKKNGRKVAYFAAGDMNRDEMEMRKYIYLARKSERSKYCGDILIPVLDCWKNQTGSCKLSPGLSPFSDRTEKFKTWDRKLKFSELIQNTFREFPDHVVCRKCVGKGRFDGSVWLKIRPACEPLTWKEGYQTERDYVKRMRGSAFYFDEYPADTLSPRMIEIRLETWRRARFEPDVILIDYPDIMDCNEDDRRMDFRHRKNSIWKKLRALAHKFNCLVVAVTQADAEAYKRDWLELDNFSEDKRQYAHATAFFGLNQNEEESKVGLFRINQLIVRSGKRGNNFATVLQRLEIGRPHLGSF